MSEKIFAAVPTYNAGDYLLRLSEQLRREEFDNVFILDDCSTDGSIEAVRDHYPEFTIVTGDENKGPAGNRNRIIPHLNGESVFFIDADMTIESSNIKAQIRRALGEKSVGMVGGLILAKNGRPMWWNYGFEMDHNKDRWFYQKITSLNKKDLAADRLQELLKDLHAADADFHWINPDLLSLTQRKVDWVAEGCFAINGDTFKEIGGYDEKMRYHEGQDLAKRVRDQGRDVIVSPDIVATHNELEVRADTREHDFREGQFYFFNKHYAMTREEFDRLFSS